MNDELMIFYIIDFKIKEDIQTFQKRFLIKNQNVKNLGKLMTQNICGYLLIEAYENSFTTRVT